MDRKSTQREKRERSWVELCCEPLQLPWTKAVLRRWLDVGVEEPEVYNADKESEDEDEEFEGSTSGNVPDHFQRQKLETFHAQYMNKKEIRICVGTWNVGGMPPPDGLEIEKWIDIEEPADIYALGFQETIPLNAGHIFGAEDNAPAIRWETIIRGTLNKIQPERMCNKYPTDSPSSTNLESFEHGLAINEISAETDSGCGEVCPLLNNNAWSASVDNFYHHREGENSGAFSSKQQEKDSLCPPQKSEASAHFGVMKYDQNNEMPAWQGNARLIKTLSNSERSGLICEEQQLNLLPCEHHRFSNSYNSACSFGAHHRSLESTVIENKSFSGPGFVSGADKVESNVHVRKQSAFVRIVSKQMVGILLSIWVRRDLKKHIQNLKVSSVGVGLLGCIGNKGSVSVSMSIYQTLVCFVCSHLTPGADASDRIRRNADVQEILRRTRFQIVPDISQPSTIHDHERIIWLGDLNYRINLSYNEVHGLISLNEWSKLAEMDQLRHELNKGQAFDGWMEGILTFPPTYKYEFGSERYVKEDNSNGKRTPAWCDRILSFGKGIQLLKYRRSELNLSDHRPVTAIYAVEVEVFSRRLIARTPSIQSVEVKDGLLSYMDDAWYGTA